MITLSNEQQTAIREFVKANHVPDIVIFVAITYPPHRYNGADVTIYASLEEAYETANNIVIFSEITNFFRANEYCSSVEEYLNGLLREYGISIPE